MTNKKSAVTAKIDALKKKYGVGSIFRGDDASIEGTEFSSSGSIKLDAALGGGYALGRIIEIYGKPSSGKTSFTYMAIARLQATDDRPVLFIDTEQTANLEYAETLGVDINAIYLSQPGDAHTALNLLYDAVESEVFSMVVLDSVAALVPQQEIDGDIEDGSVAIVARLMSKHLRKLNSSKSNTTVVYINQLRTNIGFMSGNVTTGGNALAYYATQRLEIVRTSYIKKGDDVIGNMLKITVTKNKVAPPRKVARVEFMYGLGVLKSRELLPDLVKKKIVTKTASWYRYHSKEKPDDVVVLGNGVPAASSFLEDNKEFAETLYSKLYESPKKEIDGIKK